MKTIKAKNGKEYTKKQITEAIAYWENRLVSLNESNDDEFKKIDDIAKYLDGKKDLKLSDRTYLCPICGNVIDRDFQAALNLKRYGEAELAKSAS